jgi:hypothetical protein
MKALYIVAIIGLVLVGCADRQQPTITLANESTEGHIAQLIINDLWLVAYPQDTDSEPITLGTYGVQILIWEPLLAITALIDDTITITDDTECIIMRDGVPVTWE